MKKKIKVVFDRKACIGAGSCEALCPKYWKMAEDGKAVLKGAEFNPNGEKYRLEAEVNKKDLSCLKESAESCPVQAIEIYA